ncbi:MAG: protein kinase [candidate division Zixibacteria bacterium]|nr:protein kinase [candidate division Zixibacteria bacterium]
MLGHFRIVRLIGTGGLGDVYLANDDKLRRKVAIKLLHRRTASGEIDTRRLEREAQAAARLNDPHIVTIYETGEFRSEPFLAMEYVEGVALRSILDRPELTPAKIIDIARQVLLGLEAAHKAGVIHRDIKPHNIMIDQTGKVKICDFGIATTLPEPDSSDSKSTFGTIAYMSPEQVTGSIVDRRSDLFSLGVVMYRALTGRLPFAGEYEASVLYSIVHTDPPAPGELNTDLSPDLSRFVQKLLQKDPAARFQTAREALNELSTWSRDPHPSGSVPDREQALDSPVGHRRILSVAVVVLLIAAGFVAAIWNSVPWRTPPARPSIAVLPFDNLGRPEDQYFADGITDAIITELAQESSVAVISRGSVMQYRRTSRPLPDIASELGVDYIVSGTVAWDRDSGQGRVRTNAALVRARDDLNIWANSYDQRLGGLFQMQSSIAEDVCRSLQIKVSQNSSEIPTANLKAYDLYLRGMDYFNRGWERENILLARQMFRNAADLDSTFALAWVMLARADASMYWEYFDRTEDRKRSARDATNMALSLSPELADAHLAHGYYLYHCENQFDAALAEFEIAMLGQPSNAELLNAIAAVKRRQGELVQSLEYFKRSLQLDPRSPLKALDVGLTLGMLRKYHDVDEYVDRSIALSPDWALPYIYKAWTRILANGDTESAKAILDGATSSAGQQLAQSQYYWWIYRILEPNYEATLQRVGAYADPISSMLFKAQLNRLLGRTEVSRAQCDSARVLIEPKLADAPQAARYHSYLGLAYAGLGDKGKALEHGREALNLLPASRDLFDAPFLLLNLAEILTIVGENEEAIKQLEYLVSLPGFVSVPYIKAEPLFNALHDEPAYKKLVAAHPD